MNTHSNEPSENPDAFYLNAREREGRTIHCENIQSHYGRRMSLWTPNRAGQVVDDLPCFFGGSGYYRRSKDD